jgi:NADPH:quinone reductase-like Zn-dependent oxidoreductase
VPVARSAQAESLPPGCVAVAVHAVGVNFRDVLNVGVVHCTVV